MTLEKRPTLGLAAIAISGVLSLATSPDPSDVFEETVGLSVVLGPGQTTAVVRVDVDADELLVEAPATLSADADPLVHWETRAPCEPYEPSVDPSYASSSPQPVALLCKDIANGKGSFVLTLVAESPGAPRTYGIWATARRSTGHYTIPPATLGVQIRLLESE